MPKMCVFITVPVSAISLAPGLAGQRPRDPGGQAASRALQDVQMLATTQGKPVGLVAR
jgi:hypothetical protein